MKALWLKVVDALAQQERGTSLAIFRIAVGATVFGELFLTWHTGAMALLWHGPDAGGFTRLAAAHWVWKSLGYETATIDAVFWTTCGAALLVAAGLGTRLASAVALFGLQALFALSSGSGGGHDRMFLIALFVLVFARSDATLSVGCRLRTGQWVSKVCVPRWPRVLIVWNLTLIYVSSGVVKIATEWLPQGRFRAVYNALLTPYWARADYSAWLGHVFPLTQLGTAITVVWEMSFWMVPLWLTFRFVRLDVRSVYVAIGVVMHGTLWIAANLGPFTPIVWAWYALLYGPGEWERFFSIPTPPHERSTSEARALERSPAPTPEPSAS